LEVVKLEINIKELQITNRGARRCVSNSLSF